jgi:hypothetical protein
VTAKVTGAQPGKPMWLVLGQSYNEGWTASTGGHSLGAPRLVDAYANGWMVNPTSSDFTVTMRWKPQREVDVALVLTVIAVMISLAVLLGSLVANRRSRRYDPADAGASQARPVTTMQRDGDDEFDLVDLRADGRPGGSRVAGVLGAVLFSVAVAVLTHPLTGAVTLALLLATVLWRRGRLLLRAAAVGAALLGALYVLQVQVRYQLPTDIGWVKPFDKLVWFAWLPIALLAADGIAGRLGRRPQFRWRRQRVG